MGLKRKTPRGWIQIGESRTRGVARIPLGLKPSRDSRATSQRDSPIWIQPLGVFRYITPHHINTKELATVVMAAQAWSRVWANHHVAVFIGNRVTEAAVNNDTARNSTCLHLLKHLAALALQFNFDISAVYIPGVDNTIADTISRLHEPGKLNWLSCVLNVPVSYLLQNVNMSAKSRHFLFQGFPRTQPYCN